MLLVEIGYLKFAFCIKVWYNYTIRWKKPLEVIYMELNLEEIMMTIGDETTMRIELNNLRAVAASRGKKLTLEIMAKELGCSISHISFWLKGERMFGMELRFKMRNYIEKMKKEFEVAQ